MTGVETRKGPVATLLKRHLISAVTCFILVLAAFKWIYVMKTGIIILFSVAATIHMLCTVYSYTYYQATVDLRDNGKYNFKSPLKLGIISSLIIIVPAVIHIIIVKISPMAGELLGYFARLWNYPFFWFFYGTEGNWYNYTAMAIVTVIPVFVAYLAYFLSTKHFSFLSRLNKLFYKR